MKYVFPLACIASLVAASADAQTTRSVKSTREAYGARLDAAAQPNNLNTARINNRLDSGIDNRLSLRIERYRVGQTSDPTAAYRVQTDDHTRMAPAIAPPQPSTQDPQ